MNLTFILIIITSTLGGQHNINHVTDSNSLNVNTFNFPDDFLWGTATAAHQVEGNCVKIIGLIGKHHHLLMIIPFYIASSRQVQPAITGNGIPKILGS